MVSTIARLLTAALVWATAAGGAQAAFFAGDPVADFWTPAGNSQALGRYIRGTADFNFTMYRTLYTVVAGDRLAVKAGWSAEHIVFGMGGVLAPRSLTVPVVNENVTGSVRIVSKYAAAFAPGFVASDTLTTPGNGLGNFSAGDGGDGSVLLSTSVGAITLANAGMLLTPEFRFQYDATMLGTNGNVLDPDVARFVYTVDENSLLKSWQVFLNVSKLPTTGPNPSYSADWDQALQRGTKKFTDGLNAASSLTPSAFRRAAVLSDGDGGPDAVATPLPPTLLALAAGAALLGLRRRRS